LLFNFVFVLPSSCPSLSSFLPSATLTIPTAPRCLTPLSLYFLEGCENTFPECIYHRWAGWTLLGLHGIMDSCLIVHFICPYTLTVMLLDWFGQYPGEGHDFWW
jgi:hypothetical protein